MQTSGKIELDFYGGGAENKAHLMMRHAYMKFDWPDQRLSLIAGQTWDVISPLNPSTLNYSVQWWEGNIGYRRPQVRVTKGFALTEEVDLTLAAAIARTVGRSAPFGVGGADLSPGDTGEDEGPHLQCRTALSFPLVGGRKTTVGVSGHWDREEMDLDASDNHKTLHTWSANVDVTQPITDALTLKAEAFVGENLDAFLGGIGQGVNMTTLDEIGSRGGWVAASYKPSKAWTFNLGTSFDDPNDSDLNPGMREFHRSCFGNVVHAINDCSSVGVELSHRRTDYKGAPDGDSFRVQTSFIFKF